MVPFLILVKFNGVVYQIGHRDPEEYRTLRLFREVKDVLIKQGYNNEDRTELSVVLPWTENKEKRWIFNDSKLYSVFEEFFVNNYPAIEFEVEVKKLLDEEDDYRSRSRKKMSPSLSAGKFNRDVQMAKLFQLKLSQGRRGKKNRGFTLKFVTSNDVGGIERSTGTTQGGLLNEFEVVVGSSSSSSSGGIQAGESSRNVRRQVAAARGLQLQLHEPAAASSKEEGEQASPWACF